jgi:hypothetical protein
MPEDGFSALLTGTLFRHFPAGVKLASEGKPPNFFYVLVEGRIELLGIADGKDTTIKIVEPVATFLLAVVVMDAAFLTSARTFEPCRVLMIPASNVRHSLLANPSRVYKNPMWGKAVTSVNCSPSSRRAAVDTKLEPHFQAGDVVEHIKKGKSYLVLVVGPDKCLLKQEGAKGIAKWIPTSNLKLGPSLP